MDFEDARRVLFGGRIIRQGEVEDVKAGEVRRPIGFSAARRAATGVVD